MSETSVFVVEKRVESAKIKSSFYLMCLTTLNYIWLMKQYIYHTTVQNSTFVNRIKHGLSALDEM